MTTTSHPTGVLAQHQQALNEGHFLLQHCSACSRSVYFPREICPHCGSTAWQWQAPSGLGTVHAVTTVKRKPGDGGDLNVCLVELDEGVRLMSRVEGLPPAGVTIGLRVKARVWVDGGRGIVVFDPVQGAGS